MKIYKCSWCEAETQETVIHHIVPKAKGGGDNPGNLVELCYSCHGKVHGKDFVEMRRLQREGIEAAKRAGVYKGRKAKYLYDTVHCIFTDLFDGRTPTSIANEGLTNGQNISRASIYKVLGDINISLKDKTFSYRNKKYWVASAGLHSSFESIEQVITNLSNLSTEQIQQTLTKGNS